MSDLRDLIQAKLGNAYAIGRELTGGGMSRVFVATEVALDRQVVIKVLSPDLAQGVSVDRFKREIQLVAQLQHPHIVPVLSAGDVNGLPFFSMPFVEGESLRARLARGEFPIADVVSILRDVAKALDTAHAKGIVHRDIKPDNVLMSGGSAMVTDFGVAKAIASASSMRAPVETLTQRGFALGTPLYMAPEQAAADPATDHRADIYALGTVAYEMLVGRAPFAGRTSHQLAAAHATEPPVQVTLVRPAVPAMLGALVMQCLEKHPADRPQSARDFLHALDAVSTPSAGAASAGVRRSSKRMIAAATGVAALLVTALVAYKSWPQRALIQTRVSVFPLANLSGDTSLAEISNIASSWIASGISEMDSADVVPPQSILEQLARTKANDEAGRKKIAESFGSGTSVTGGFLKQGDSLRFDAIVTEVATGKTLRSVYGVMGPVGDPMVGIRVLRDRLMGALATPDVASRVQVGNPPLFDALREHELGRKAFTSRDYKLAATHFRRALEIDSTFVSAYGMLALAHHNASQYRESDSVLQIVERRGQHASAFDVFGMRSLRALLDGKRDVSLALAREAAAKDPSWVPQYLLGLESVHQNYPHSAIRAFEAALKNPDQFLPFWWNYTRAYHQAGDFVNELRIAGMGDSVFPGQLITHQLRALASVGDTARLRAIIDSIDRVSVDSVGQAASRSYVAGLELRAHGHAEAATRMFAQARQWLAKRAPAKSRAERALTADVLFVLGKSDSASVLYRELSVADTTVVGFRARVASSAARMGDTVTALRIDGELANLRIPYQRGSNSFWRASIAAILGDKPRAVQLLNLAISEGWSVNEDMHRFEEFQSLRGYAPYEALLRPRD